MTDDRYPIKDVTCSCATYNTKCLGSLTTYRWELNAYDHDNDQDQIRRKVIGTVDHRQQDAMASKDDSTCSFLLCVSRDEGAPKLRQVCPSLWS
jgi:hypothetical protein